MIEWKPITRAKEHFQMMIPADDGKTGIPQPSCPETPAGVGGATVSEQKEIGNGVARKKASGLEYASEVESMNDSETDSKTGSEIDSAIVADMTHEDTTGKHKRKPRVKREPGPVAKAFLRVMNWILPPQRVPTCIVFFAAIALMQFAMLLRGIYPYGGKTMLIVDLYHQYAPFLAELRERLLSGSSLFFSWTGGLGVSFYATMSYYLASPLNLLLIVFPAGYLTEAILTIMLIKVGLSASCFLIWVRGVYQKDGYAVMALSLMYALSGFTLAYFWNIMWMDCLFLLPLVLLGIHRLVMRGSGLLYAITMGLTLFVNFYIAFFAAIFTSMVFLALLVRHARELGARKVWVRIGQFTLFSLFAGGISAIMVLPTFEAMRHTSATGDTFPKDISAYFDLFDYFARQLIAVKPTIRSGMPNLYSGIAVILLLPAYFFSRRVSRLEKTVNFLFMLFLIVSFNINVLNFIWHGLHYPNQLPYRNSFVWALLLLWMAVPAFESIKEYTGRQWGTILGVGLAMVLLSQKIVVDDKPGFPEVYLDILFLLVYAIVFSATRLDARKVFNREFVFFLVVVLELGVNTSMVIAKLDKSEYFSTRDEYVTGNEVSDIRVSIDRLEEMDDSLFRMSISPAKTPNDPYLYGFNGLSIFSSMSREVTAAEFSRYGFHSNDINSYKDEGSTPVWDALLGIRYRLVRNTGEEIWSRETPGDSLFSIGTSSVFRNPDALSIGYAAPESLKSWSSKGQNPFQIQNKLMKLLGGEQDLFTPIEVVDTSAAQSTMTSTQNGKYHVDYPDKNKQAIVKLTLDDPGEGHLCLWYEAPTVRFGIGNVFVGDRKIRFNSTRSTLVDIGDVKAGEKVVVELWPNSKEEGAYDFTLIPMVMDETRFKTAVGRIRAKQLDILEMRDTGLTANISAPENGTLMFTIPYDEGWQVKVDGIPTVTYAIDEGLLGCDIAAGVHVVDMRFVPTGFWLGLEITFFCLLFMVIGLVRKSTWLMGDVVRLSETANTVS